MLHASRPLRYVIGGRLFSRGFRQHRIDASAGFLQRRFDAIRGGAAHDIAGADR